MTMPATPSSFAGRIAYRSLALALRLWPEETREWGAAVLAEMGEMAEPAESFNWAAGGIMLFFRAIFSRALDWLRLPSGGTITEGVSSSGSKLPRPPRWTTALLLLGAVGLLLLPQGQEAVSSLEASWRHFELSASDHRKIGELAVRAENAKDAKGVAFAALSDPRTEQAVQIADRAVALDQKLVWIYASRFQRPAQTPLNKERIEQLQSADPENAFVYLYAACVEVEPQLQTLHERGLKSDVLEATLADDDKWMELMGRAFRAPRYDSYYDKHQELSREVWSRERDLGLAPVVYSLWSHSMPSVTEIVTFAKLRIREAGEKRAANHPEQAEQILGEIQSFGERMSAGTAPGIEKMTGLDVARRGVEELQKLYASTGREAEARDAAAELARIEARKTQMANSFVPVYAAAVEPYGRRAVFVQCAALFGIFSGLATLFCLLSLELGAGLSQQGTGIGRRVLRLAADYGPLLFLVSSAGFLLSFRPFAGFLTEYRAANSPSIDPRVFAGRLFALEAANPLAVLGDAYVRWLVLTVTLAAIATGVLLRGILRGKQVG